MGFAGEVSNPGPPRTRARVRMEQEAEAEATLSCLEAALTHIDDSDDDPLVTWRDEVSESAEMGRREDVRNVHVSVMWKLTQVSHQHCWIHWWRICPGLTMTMRGS